ncbi:MAG: polymorphic toxin type 28 domain-containing protein, partial [Desulfosporosinus sp.]|nr:polymorphic toxin type 28 domain-containing protein [Desulfosporosinus sp.]
IMYYDPTGHDSVWNGKVGDHQWVTYHLYDNGNLTKSTVTNSTAPSSTVDTISVHSGSVTVSRGDHVSAITTAPNSSAPITNNGGSIGTISTGSHSTNNITNSGTIDAISTGSNSTNSILNMGTIGTISTGSHSNNNIVNSGGHIDTITSGSNSVTHLANIENDDPTQGMSKALIYMSDCGATNDDLDPQGLVIPGLGSVILTRTQNVTLDRLNNIINDHLTESDFSGTEADLQGKPIPNTLRGDYWNHQGEMEDSLNGLNSVRKSLEGSLQNPNLDQQSKQVLQEALNKTSFYIDKINNLFDKYKGGGPGGSSSSGGSGGTDLPSNNSPENKAIVPIIPGVPIMPDMPMPDFPFMPDIPIFGF